MKTLFFLIVAFMTTSVFAEFNFGKSLDFPLVCKLFDEQKHMLDGKIEKIKDGYLLIKHLPPSQYEKKNDGSLFVLVRYTKNEKLNAFSEISIFLSLKFNTVRSVFSEMITNIEIYDDGKGYILESDGFVSFFECKKTTEEQLNPLLDQK